MNRHSLKYRIAILIFLLEAVMMALVLGITLTDYLTSNRKVAATHETVLLNILGDLSRIALFTAEYDELQPYIEEVVNAPGVRRVLLLNNKDRVVVSSDVTDVGKDSLNFITDENNFWRVEKINNEAGELGKLAINFSHDGLVQANRRAIDIGISTGLAGMIIIAVIGVIIGHLLTRRLSALNDAAQRIADGDLTVTADVTGKDEVSRLAQSFNQMASNVKNHVDELQNSQVELRKAHDNLEHRILERTAELAVARDQSIQANRVKSSFLANMSHELRTPLNAIIGYAEVLLDEIDLRADKLLLDDVTKIKHSGQHLLSLINDILDISKIESGKITLDLTEFDVIDIIHEVASNIEPLSHLNNNRLNIIHTDDTGSMYADKIKLLKILINLLGNAVKFTRNGEIRFEIHREKVNGVNSIVFVIKDTGIGIKVEHLQRIFEEFSQAEPSTTRQYGGTGLGLAISKRYCELMGGHISVTSQEGEGSTFSVSLPTIVTASKFSDDSNHLANHAMTLPEDLA